MNQVGGMCIARIISQSVASAFKLHPHISVDRQKASERGGCRFAAHLYNDCTMTARATSDGVIVTELFMLVCVTDIVITIALRVAGVVRVLRDSLGPVIRCGQ